MSSQTGEETWGRRFEAMVFVLDSAETLPAAAAVLATLRAQGFIAAVIAPPPLAELTAALGAESVAAGTLLLGADRGCERAVAEHDRVRALPFAQVHVDPMVLEEAGRAVAERLAVLGFSAVLDPPVTGGLATIALGEFGDHADGQVDGDELLSIAVAAARDAGLDDPRGDVRRLAPVDRGRGERGAVRWALDELWDRGVGPAEVLVVERQRVDVGDLLADQLRRRGTRELPRAEPAPGWSLVIDDFDPERERAHSALLALGDGRVGTSGAPLSEHPSTHPWVLAAGVYQGSGPETRLLTAPIALHLPYLLGPDTELRRVLDLRTGVLHEQVAPSRATLATIRRSDEGTLSSVRFSSLARPGTVVLRAICPDARPRVLLLPPSDDELLDEGVEGTARWMRVAAATGGIAAAAVEVETPSESDGRVVDRVAFYASGPETLPEPGTAVESADARARWGFDRLLAEHRRAWAERWQDADIIIEGDDELQLATRLQRCSI